MFPDKEFSCISRERGMRQLEQRADLMWLFVQEDHTNRKGGWTGAGKGCSNTKAEREAMRPALGQVLQEWRGSERGETFLQESQLPLLIIGIWEWSRDRYNSLGSSQLNDR